MNTPSGPPGGHEAWAEAEQIWQLGLSEAEFLAYAAMRAGAGGADVAWSDLYLAYGCWKGVPQALRTIDDWLASEVRKATKKTSSSAVTPDDLAQSIREQLFVGTRERPAKISDYAGKGSLRGWLRVIVARTLINGVTRAPKEVELDEAVIDAFEVSSAKDPELEHFKIIYAHEFRLAFKRAIDELEPRDRNLLRYSLVKHLGLDEIGRLLGVHKSTVSRQLDALREDLAAKVQRQFQASLGARTQEAHSILGMVRSRINITIERYLNVTAIEQKP